LARGSSDPVGYAHAVSARSCPDWPEFLELAPDLHFKHYTVAEARLPAEALVHLRDIPLEAVAICADLDHHVFNADHTDPSVATALLDTHWFDLREWISRGPRPGV
jgi:hypothetical protein